MGGIAGIVGDDGNNEIGNSLKQMLQTITHHGLDGVGFMIGRVVERKKKLEDLNLEGKKGAIALGHVGLVAITDGAVKLQPCQSKNGQLTLLYNGKIYNHSALCSELNGEGGVGSDRDTKAILRLIEKQYRGDLSTAMRKVIPKLDGVFALAVTDNKQTVIARDKIGLRQLYFYINDNHVAFASEKKPLMAISSDHKKIHRLLPGHMATLDGRGVHDYSYWTPASIRSRNRIKNREKALKVYGQAIRRSIHKRVASRKRVGILFSGGIDSFPLAYMVQELGVPFTCYTAGLQGAVDIEWACSRARRFNFPLKLKILTLEEIEELIPEIITIIEDHSLNQVEAAIPMFAAVKMAQKAGEQAILTGQGPDEIFGGYPWYPKIVDQEGYESFEQRSWEDTLLSYKETFERENKIAMAHGLEMIVPYVDPEVIEVAFQIPPELKILRGNDRLGKRIHREYCLSIGIPEDIALRKKDAAQHSADAHNALKELAGRTGVTKSMLEDAGYDPDQSVIEKLGSSSRYGFRYVERYLWKPSPEVQYYLDSHAARLNLLPPKSRTLWHKTTRKLRAKGVPF